jgi:hypothetical protein
MINATTNLNIDYISKLSMRNTALLNYDYHLKFQKEYGTIPNFELTSELSAR